MCPLVCVFCAVFCAVLCASFVLSCASKRWMVPNPEIKPNPSKGSKWGYMGLCPLSPNQISLKVRLVICHLVYLYCKERKTTPTTSCVLSDAWESLKSFSDSKMLVRNYLCLKNYATSEGVVSHNVLYYQQLSVAHYQVNCYANIFFSYYRKCPVPLNSFCNVVFVFSDHYQVTLSPLHLSY